MTDEEFLNLNPFQAAEALKTLPTGDQVRLRILFSVKHADRVGSTLIPGATVPGHVPKCESGMLKFGRFFFWGGIVIGLCGTFVAMMMVGGGSVLGPVTVIWIAASAIGLGSMMWMLGALEQRLIEIRERLHLQFRYTCINDVVRER